MCIIIEVFIVDDYDFKREEIKNYINDICPNSNILEFETRNSFLRFLHENSSKYNSALLILDWCFPIMDDMPPEVGMGQEVLEEIDRLKKFGRVNTDINIILCSSDEIDEYDSLKNEYDNLIGFVKYDSSVYLKNIFKDLIQKIE